MKIRNKEYMEVKDRVMIFRKNNPNWAIITKIVENCQQTGSVIFSATIEDENGRIRGTGHAHEFKDDKTSMVNKTSHLENCETSAIGRALASIGIGIESSYATYDEVMIALDKEERMERSDAHTTEGKIRQSTENPLPEKKSSVKVISPWMDFKLDKGKYEGLTLGEISKIPRKGSEGSGDDYIKWMAGLEDMKDQNLRKALDQALKELDGNGKQGFKQVG